MPSTVFDYAIIGAGNAGLQLAMAMMRQPWLKGKSVLILEKENKLKDNKTWCYWEEGAGKWDSLLTKSWSNGLFVSKSKERKLNLNPYMYKMLRAKDFNAFCKNEITQHPDFTWESDSVENVSNLNNICTLKSYSGKSWQATKVFDSRLPEDFHQIKDKHLRLLQHFKGWEIETDKPIFNPNEFTMMDFRVKWQDSTSFTYVLPISETKALVEFTLFTPDLINDSEYDLALKKYIKSTLGIVNYKIIRVEGGVIPMTTFPFHKVSNPHNVTKIGTAGSWVKPSTGYSFKNTERQVNLLIKNINKGLSPSKGLINKRARLMDTLLLDILVKNNSSGEGLFVEMYHNNSIQKIFKFLDEETSLIEDIRMAASFSPKPFLKAISNQLL